MVNEYDNAIHTVWLDNGRWLAFSKLIDGKNMAEMRTMRTIPLVDGDLRTTINMLKSAWALAGISNYKHLVHWIKKFEPLFATDRFAVRLCMKLDKQVTYNDVDGSYVSTFYLQIAPNPETLAKRWYTLDDDDWSDLLSWLHNNFGLRYACWPSPGGTGVDLRYKQQAGCILVETSTWRDV